MIIRINSDSIADVEYKRILDLEALLTKKSFFLFGPRSTGKTYLINKQLSNKSFIIDLLNMDMLLRLSAAPQELEDLIRANPGADIIIIDEIQKVPELLNEVHRLIEAKKYKFLLTGSSARKLRKTGADMLAGRAWTAKLFPLCTREISEFNLDRYLRYGGLPQVYPSADPAEELYSYVDTYLREEIREEGLIRNLPPFSRFLKSAALSNGQIINFSKIGSDCAVSPSTVREYYAILDDTLVGFNLEPWIFSKKRKAIQTAKFYFFDTGVTHTLAGTKSLERNSNLYGNSFEQLIAMELRAYLSYKRIKDELTFWRSTHGFEVDFLIGEHTAIEVKATNKISKRDLVGLRALTEEKVFKNFFLVSQDKVCVKKENILVVHWREFLNKLWDDQLF